MKLFALIDCDNFYVSCELLFKPALKDKPVVVLSRNDAVIVARSKKAKELNIPMGAPVFKIQNYLKKHDVITLPSNLPLYAHISKKVMNIILETFPQTIIYSIDEAFIDISNQIDKPREKIKSGFHLPKRENPQMDWHTNKHRHIKDENTIKNSQQNLKTWRPPRAKSDNST
jgi:nucleotidyltransferase/DNA polymerase involved in DNA repair